MTELTNDFLLSQYSNKKGRKHTFQFENGDNIAAKTLNIFTNQIENRKVARLFEYPLKDKYDHTTYRMFKFGFLRDNPNKGNDFEDMKCNFVEYCCNNFHEGLISIIRNPKYLVEDTSRFTCFAIWCFYSSWINWTKIDEIINVLHESILLSIKLNKKNELSALLRLPIYFKPKELNPFRVKFNFNEETIKKLFKSNIFSDADKEVLIDTLISTWHDTPYRASYEPLIDTLLESVGDSDIAEDKISQMDGMLTECLNRSINTTNFPSHFTYKFCKANEKDTLTDLGNLLKLKSLKLSSKFNVQYLAFFFNSFLENCPNNIDCVCKHILSTHLSTRDKISLIADIIIYNKMSLDTVREAILNLKDLYYGIEDNIVMDALEGFPSSNSEAFITSTKRMQIALPYFYPNIPKSTIEELITNKINEKSISNYFEWIETLETFTKRLSSLEKLHALDKKIPIKNNDQLETKLIKV